MRLPAIASDVKNGQGGLYRDFPQLRRAAMNELSAKLDRRSQCIAATGEDAPTDSLPSLEYDDIDASAVKDSCCLESGNAGADDRDIRSCVVHLGRC